jgi:hypothetical protein
MERHSQLQRLWTSHLSSDSLGMMLDGLTRPWDKLYQLMDHISSTSEKSLSEFVPKLSHGISQRSCLLGKLPLLLQLDALLL